MSPAAQSLTSHPVDPARMPWIPMGPPGLSFKPLRFFRDGSGWMYIFRLEPGTLIPRHRHTGEVHAVNLSGTRKLLDTGDVVGPGGYVYEPAGNTDSWMAIGDEPVVILITVRGAIEYLDAEGRVTKSVGSAERLATYRRWCEANGAEFLATLE
ncbi:2,4'-dihydroxyacetophenone dioxygenase family protein [Myxococcus sp. CA039A]|uniref:2,4'-dihydroxyacetophenone dioxygenase family protein n=1 Tax=Myxococcus sp. CA039A TaxID=2741737 RepID=UPI00157AED02|nr:2,4'-dihydroxyacetophenone dioxygenase family protein [Myxococcus sp. CA039A]NTX56284.1 2,4'-dihydroxyacetophenone dioxygenase family protein [Myxococcus sp. CA039A]